MVLLIEISKFDEWKAASQSVLAGAGKMKKIDMSFSKYL
jgi:hypothetical protein